MPEALASLAEYGILEEVVRPLMSGKEAQVYLVRSDGEQRVAKVYKEAQDRTFKNRAEYTEGRKVRNSRDQRAMGKGSRHGRAQAEVAWRTTEVDMIYRLRAAGVRVPTPYHFIDGVLVMEMITDEHGEPAPRLGDVVLDPDGAQAVFDLLLAEVVRMLAAGVVHGDLSDFNVLMGTDGPVIIDFPQAVDASSNQNARKLLLRDVDNLHRYMARFAPTRRALPYAQEMWALYERGELTPDSKLTGRYQVAERKVSTEAVLGLIGDATRDERRRREHLGLSMRGAAEEAVEAESAPRPVSRYAQKREEKVAARKLEALNKPPVQRAGPRDGHGHAAHEKPRPRTGEQARGHTQRVTPGDGHGHAAHEKPRPRAGEQARGHTQRVTPGDGHGHAAHEKPRPRTGEQARGATQRATGAHEPPRARHANAAHAARGNAGGDAPRDAGRRTASAQDRGHAAAKPAPQRPAHPKLDHGRQQAASGANANSAEAAPKRRRRRRKRKPGEGAPSGPGR